MEVAIVFSCVSLLLIKDICVSEILENCGPIAVFFRGLFFLSYTQTRI